MMAKVAVPHTKSRPLPTSPSPPPPTTLTISFHPHHTISFYLPHHHITHHCSIKMSQKDVEVAAPDRRNLVRVVGLPNDPRDVLVWQWGPPPGGS